MMKPNLPPIPLSAIQEVEAAELVERIRVALAPDEAAAAFATSGEMVADGEITDGGELLDELDAVLGASGQ
jgi:hypothetical protein